jgi:coproporphyrinogen III oxidase-like Fe-S oxidoreductase
MYRTKQYLERSWEDLKVEIDLAAKAYPQTRRIFLADGDALNVSTDRLIQVLDYIYSKFSNLQRVSCYAMPKNLLQKTDIELGELKAAGLGMLYIGIESGSDIVLKKVTKGATSKAIVQGCQKAKGNGFLLSCMIILGLGGRTYSNIHIHDTARIVSEIAPNYLAVLTLNLENEIYEEFMTKFGEPFVPLEDIELLDELEGLISHLDLDLTKPIIFRANHASSIYPLTGTLPQDKENVLSLIRGLRSHPEMLKPKIFRKF